MNAPQADMLTPTVTELDAGPGQRLRSAREAASLSIEEVAARLHLDTRTIRNLESDSYEHLPAPIFVRGYLRNYARLLNIAAEPLIDGFDRRGLQPPALIADISTSEEAKSTDIPMRLATYGIALALLAGVVIWGQSQFGGTWGDADAPADGGTLEGPILPGLGTPTGGALTPLPALPALREGAELPALGGTATPETGAPGGAGQDPLGRSTPLDPPGSGPAAQGAGTETQPPPAETAPPGVGHLLLRVRRDVWIEVYDRDGARLYYDTARAGDSIDLRAAEPLRVLVGFARGVQVEYNGEVFDPAPHTARGVARFTLGNG